MCFSHWCYVMHSDTSRRYATLYGFDVHLFNSSLSLFPSLSPSLSLHVAAIHAFPMLPDYICPSEALDSQF